MTVGEETVPCETCIKPTTYRGTKRCNECWEVEGRLSGYLKSDKGRAFVLKETLNVGGCFRTFGEWVNKAKSWIGGMDAACFDSKGRLCRVGRDFMRARDEGAFPVWFVLPTPHEGEVIRTEPATKREAAQREIAAAEMSLPRCPHCKLSLALCGCHDEGLTGHDSSEAK